MMGLQLAGGGGSVGVSDGTGSTQPAPKPGQQTGAQQSSIMQPT